MLSRTVILGLRINITCMVGYSLTIGEIHPRKRNLVSCFPWCYSKKDEIQTSVMMILAMALDIELKWQAGENCRGRASPHPLPSHPQTSPDDALTWHQQQHVCGQPPSSRGCVGPSTSRLTRRSPRMSQRQRIPIPPRISGQTRPCHSKQTPISISLRCHRSPKESTQ